jgi:hypothetical protein
MWRADEVVLVFGSFRDGVRWRIETRVVVSLVERRRSAVVTGHSPGS